MKKAENPETAYYLGDSERRDVEGAGNLGMITVRISEEKGGSSADYIASDLYDAAIWISNRKDYKGT